VDWELYFQALGFVSVAGFIAWLFSVYTRNVSFVDSLWSLFFLLMAAVYALASQPMTDRGWLVLVLVAIWSIRLSAYITIRNHGQAEDYRYRTIRANNDPGFWFKSFYIVFLLQGVLAWIISLPLLGAITSRSALGGLDMLALGLFVIGLAYEAGGDYQLARFKKSPDNAKKVLDTGLWRHTRHPNYFGDFCIWWSFYLFAVAAGAWWSIAAPLLMSILLLKVSGVAMLEKTIGNRRPEYAEYIHRTNAFFPGPRRPIGATAERTDNG
jgi:steroid 5-alpha reductase family enzyme